MIGAWNYNDLIIATFCVNNDLSHTRRHIRRHHRRLVVLQVDIAEAPQKLGSERIGTDLAYHADRHNAQGCGCDSLVGALAAKAGFKGFPEDRFSGFGNCGGVSGKILIGGANDDDLTRLGVC